jgi:tetratricopeptide (TPR) repeat protein
VGADDQSRTDAIDDTLPATADTPAPADSRPARGDTVGRFVVLEELGAGGMGVVFAAYDPDLDRRVAIKLLHASTQRDDARARLLREAQAMAKIDHPNVVRVHEVGTFRDQVYVAMEFVAGGTLRTWLQSPRATRDIVDVFVQAGSGLAAAHARGLIHRDFKPDNVLLTKDGQVRVTDFGLVSTLDEAAQVTVQRERPLLVETSRMTPLSERLTHTGAMMGTPAYMAPEQLTGTASPQSDQFSLCVTLYEALFGERPFRATTVMEVSAKIVTGEIDAPTAKSTRAVPRWLRKIVLRGLAVDPAARFPAMTDLVAALRHDPARLRARLAIGGGVGVLAIAGTFGIVAATRPAADTCVAGADRVSAAWSPDRRAALAAAFDASKRSYAATTLAHASDRLDAWADDWRAGFASACGDATVESGALAERRTACLLDELDATRATVDALLAGGPDAVDHAVSAVEQLPPVSRCADRGYLIDADVDAPAAAAPALAQLHVAQAQINTGRARDALATLLPAEELARHADSKVTLARILLAMGKSKHELLDPTAAATLEQAVRAAAETTDTDLQVEAEANLVEQLVDDPGRADAAQEVAGLAEAQARRVHLPVSTTVLLDSASESLLLRLGHPKDARTRAEQALDATLASPDTYLRGTALAHAAEVAREDGRYADSVKFMTDELAIIAKLEGDTTPAYANALSNLGMVYRRQGDLASATRVYDQALAIRRAVFGDHHVAIAITMTNLGSVASDRGDRKTARDDYERALAIYQDLEGPDHIDTAGALVNVAVQDIDDNQLARARTALERALATYERIYGADGWQLVTCLTDLGVVAKDQDRLDDASKLYERGLAIVEKTYGPDHPDAADLATNLVDVKLAQHQIAEAAPLAERAVRAAEKAYGKDHPNYAFALANAGLVKAAQGDHAAALAELTESATILQAKLGDNSPALAEVREAERAERAKVGANPKAR